LPSPVDPDDAHSVIAQYLEHLLANCLASFRGAEAAERQKRLVERLVATLIAEFGDNWAEQISIVTPLRKLFAVQAIGHETPLERPDTPLARSALLTGTRVEPSLGSQLCKEIATADRVDVLCSFIKWSGLRVLLDELRRLANRPSDGPRIRVITTSYMGATDPRAVEALSELPNTEVRISYDTKLTRLHAKAYIIHRDTGFGSAYVGSANLELLVGGRDPEQYKHLFCSIQSYNSRELWQRPADEFIYIVVDEFHHAAALSYRRLLEHVRPQILLGLKATSERSDQLDVLQWFGGRASAEIRLPDAINRRLLCPFQYFGIADSVAFDALTWQRGGYRVEDLDRVYTGNDIRARLIVDKIQKILLNSRQARGLGFCVSVAHAEYMARFFNECGLPAIALTAESDDEKRIGAITSLRAREVNFIFVVDLYNEGVDIPEVDTLLFLRPTESLTVYLQQFGRGLRLHPEKDCLTVLDFIGAQRREFRFAPRFRALSTNPTARVDQDVEHGFPHLPSGCIVRLERVAQQRILSNVRESVRLLRPRMIGSIRDLGRYLGRAPSIAEALDYLDTSLDRGILANGDVRGLPDFARAFSLAVAEQYLRRITDRPTVHPPSATRLHAPLFVRETKALPSGLAAPYVFLGPCDHVSHEGSRPMSIVWRLRHAVPARHFRVMARQHIA